MKGKLLAAGAVLLVGAWLAVAGLLWVFESAAVERTRALAALGEKVAPLPSDALKPLAEACAGKLPQGGPRSIAGYLAKVDPAGLPALPKSYWTLDQSVVGLAEGARLSMHDEYLPDLRASSFTSQLKDALDPTNWGMRLSSAKAGRPELAEVKVLVAARYASFELPTKVDDGQFRWGKGAYGARVVEVPSGKVLCEGRGEVHRKLKVTASGRGTTQADAQADAAGRIDDNLVFSFILSVKGSPLSDVCEAGGKTFCELAAEWAGVY